MDFENFLAELPALEDERREILRRIKSHGLPVILYGAGIYAKNLTKKLAACDCEVAGYAVDDKYFTPNQTYLGRPVYCIKNLILQPNKYIFVLAIGDFTDDSRVKKLLNEYKINLFMLTADDMALIDKEYILSEREKFSETFSIFEDDFSRQTMLAYLRLKLAGNLSYNKTVYRNDEYFNDLTAAALTNAVGGGYLDCGAYRGDTIEAFVRWCGDNNRKVFAFEPDHENFVALKNFVRQQGYKNVSLFNCGVWNKKAVLSFDSKGNMSSAFSSSGTESVTVEKIDDVIGEEPVSFIKMDVEGSELAALNGATKIIKRDRPVLAICAYHKKEDLITLPQFIRSLYGGYKFYLRKYVFSNEHEFVLYALP